MKCLFNGEPLPALPEWNKTERPYAFIFKLSPFGYRGLIITNNAPWYDGTSTKLDIGTQYLYYNVLQDSATWEYIKEGTFNDGGYACLWTNTDIYTTDGTLYLAASDPIPVSAPQLDPLSLWMGWKAGNWVARQRGKA